MPIDRPGEQDDRPREHDDQPDSPTRRAPREPDRPAPAGELANRAEIWTEYKKAVDAEYRAYAIDRGCDRIKEAEETVVTPAMKRIESEDPTRHLIGLEHRLKGKERLSEKVTNWLKADAEMTYDQAFGMVKDAIRYTFQYREDHYVAGVQADCERLKAAGFEPVDRKNSWDAAEYKGINSRWRVHGSSQLFEVQFHTQASFGAKQETHAAYERIRDPATPHTEIPKLREFQRSTTARIPVPPGATSILDYP